MSDSITEKDITLAARILYRAGLLVGSRGYSLDRAIKEAVEKTPSDANRDDLPLQAMDHIMQGALVPKKHLRLVEDETTDG